MKPPPPMLPAPGYVTASAKAVATAASTALPPRRRIDAPTSDAMAELETTRPVVDLTTPVSCCAHEVDAAETSRALVPTESTLRKKRDMGVLERVGGSARAATSACGWLQPT